VQNEYLRLAANAVGRRRSADRDADEGPRHLRPARFRLSGPPNPRGRHRRHRNLPRAAAADRNLFRPHRRQTPGRRLTSDAPVGRIRATVRAGRDRMRARCCRGCRRPDAGAASSTPGCGTGALARRGRAPRRRSRRHRPVADPGRTSPASACPRSRGGSDRLPLGDMLDPALGHFDHVVAMDSLIHYRTDDAVASLSRLAERTSHRWFSRSRRARRCWPR
jgi:hypothetical protein